MKRVTLVSALLSSVIAAQAVAADVQYATQTEIENLGRDVTDKQVQLNNHQVQLNDHQRQLNGHQEALNNHEGRITATEGAVATQQTTLNNHTTQLADHDTRITNNTTTINNQQTQLNQQATTQVTQGNAIGLQAGQIATLNQSQQQQDQLLNEYGQRLNGYGAQTSDLDSRMTAKWNAQNALDNRQDRNIEEAKNMGAAAYAAASLQFCTQLECGFQVAAGAATLNGKQAIAVGAGGAVSQNFFLNVNVVNASSVRGAAVSGTYSFR